MIIYHSLVIFMEQFTLISLIPPIFVHIHRHIALRIRSPNLEMISFTQRSNIDLTFCIS